MCSLFLHLLTSFESKGTRDSVIVVVLDFKKRMHYWKNLLKQNVLDGAVLDLT